MAKITKNSKDQSSQIEIFRDVILAFLYSFIDVSYSFVEIVAVEIEDGSVVEESRDVVVAQLRKMSDSDCDIFDGLFE